MTPRQKIIDYLIGNNHQLTQDEQSVVIMVCHLDGLHIAELPTKAERSAAVEALPSNIADGIKGEIMQHFKLRQTAAKSDER
jgi:hypothetical protein